MWYAVIAIVAFMLGVVVGFVWIPRAIKVEIPVSDLAGVREYPPR